MRHGIVDLQLFATKKSSVPVNSIYLHLLIKLAIDFSIKPTNFMVHHNKQYFQVHQNKTHNIFQVSYLMWQ